MKSTLAQNVLYENGKLTIIFNRSTKKTEKFSRSYTYLNVPEKVYHEMMASDSIGAYFNKNIRNVYPLAN